MHFIMMVSVSRIRVITGAHYCTKTHTIAQVRSKKYCEGEEEELGWRLPILTVWYLIVV